VQLEHAPEQGSAQGVAKFDDRISDPSRADEALERRELEAALTKIKAARATVADKTSKKTSISCKRISTCNSYPGLRACA